MRRTSEPNWELVRSFLINCPGFNYSALSRRAKLQTGELYRYVSSKKGPPDEACAIIMRTLSEYGLFNDAVPSPIGVRGTAVAAQMLEWIKKHSILRISWIESEIGMPPTALSRALRIRKLPEKYVLKLYSLLSKYGFSASEAVEVAETPTS